MLLILHTVLCRYVLKELTETEKHYVLDLGLIVEVNMIPEETSKSLRPLALPSLN